MEMEKISSSLEDYLEAIAEIIEDNGHAHTKDIADKLHVKMPSVTSALQTLSAKGLIRYQSHAPVVLTAAGSERAAVIRLRHAAFNNFFREILKLSPEEANDTACKVEHIVCEKVMSRFVSLTDAIMQRSDCAELRKYLEQTMPQICSDSTEDLVSLDQLAVGQNRCAGEQYLARDQEICRPGAGQRDTSPDGGARSVRRSAPDPCHGEQPFHARQGCRPYLAAVDGIKNRKTEFSFSE